MNKASSRLTPTTTQDSWILFNPRKKICTTHNAFTITTSRRLVITAHCCLHWTRCLLMYCHNCTLLSSFGSTIRWCTVITAQCDLYLDLLSAGVLPVLYTVILCGSNINRCTTITAHCNPHFNDIMADCYPHLDPLSAGVMPLLHNSIITWTLCHHCTLLSSPGFTISQGIAIIARQDSHLEFLVVLKPNNVTLFNRKVHTHTHTHTFSLTLALHRLLIHIKFHMHNIGHSNNRCTRHFRRTHLQHMHIFSNHYTNTY